MLLCSYTRLTTPIRKNHAVRPLWVSIKKQFRKILTIKRLIANPANTTKRKKRGKNIDSTTNLCHSFSRRQLTRPRNKTRRAHSTFIRTSLAAFHSAIESKTIWPIIREIKHDRVFFDSKVFDFRKNPAHIDINVFTHCKNRTGHINIFTIPFNSPLRNSLIFKVVPKRLGYNKRRMWRIVRQIDKKRLCRILFNKIDGMASEIIHGKPLAPYRYTIMFQRRINVFTPMT